MDSVKKVQRKALFGKTGGEAIERGMVAIRFKGAGVFGDTDGDGLVALGGVGFRGYRKRGCGLPKAAPQGGDGAGASFAALVQEEPV